MVVLISTFMVRVIQVRQSVVDIFAKVWEKVLEIFHIRDISQRKFMCWRSSFTNGYFFITSRKRRGQYESSITLQAASIRKEKFNDMHIKCSALNKVTEGKTYI